MTDIERAIAIIRDRNFCGICTTAESKGLKSCKECEAYQAKNLAIQALHEKQEQKSPCDLCAYNPPSSLDGKDCCMCPATPLPEDFSFWRKEGNLK